MIELPRSRQSGRNRRDREGLLRSAPKILPRLNFPSVATTRQLPWCVYELGYFSDRPLVSIDREGVVELVNIAVERPCSL
jgi:hypothetical protein